VFDALKLLRQGPASLALQTRKGQDIINDVALPPQPHQLAKYDRFRQQHQRWRPRRTCCGTYNCYGHVFAARRTAIYEDNEVSKILADDGYKKINHATAHVGDIAIYRAKHGFVHAAQIVEIERPDPVTQLRPIWALSKWDDGSGEDCHLLNDVPFFHDGEIEIWTDRN
jgi:hypothetical protein